jgi:hypothetical protein
MRPLRSLSCLLAALAAAAPARTERPTPGPAAREIPPDTLRGHQRIDPGPPPAAPVDTPADPGAALPALPAPGDASHRFVPAATPAAPAFNPDPGAIQNEAITFTDTPYFVEDPALPAPGKTSAPALPTSPVERPAIISNPSPLTSNPADVTPLSADYPAPLPRSDVRRTEFISAHDGHGWPAPSADSYPLSARGEGYPADTQPVPDRWRDTSLAPWRRYTSGDLNEQPFGHAEPETWHWYRQSLLKGDLPVYGQDWFLALTASTETLYEDRALPLPSGVSASGPGQSDFLGSYDTSVFVQNVALDTLLFQGETVFVPPRQAFKLRLVANYNRATVAAPGLLNPDPGAPSGGNDAPTRRNDAFLTVQEAFYEYHLADLSPNYDFMSVKLGLQSFNSDFRGFIFNETQLGVRLLGNADNNHLQYNLAAFDLREKDTNSELNTFDARQQVVVVANLYRQDFLAKGYTAQVSLHGNFDHGGGDYYDTNGSIVRPAPLGSPAPHDVDVGYLGWTGDGHLGRLNINHALYHAFGRDEFNGLAGREVVVSGSLAALELSYDRDWIRFKTTALFATGDSNPTDGRATGFDSIVDNTNFFGGPFSYYVRQGFNLAGTSVAAKQRFSVLPDLRTSKTQGQANFVNPGVLLLGVGVESDLTPRLRAFLNLNHIDFDRPEPIETALFTNEVHTDLGWDFSLGLQWRPLLTDNIVVSAGYAVLLPGRGFEDIYRNTVPAVPGLSRAPEPADQLHSAIVAVTLTY